MFEKYSAVLERTDPIKFTGTIQRVQGLLIESLGPRAVVGELCQIEIEDRRIWAEVVGVRDSVIQLMPFTETEGIEAGSKVRATGGILKIPVSEQLLGRVLDSLGRPIDGKGVVAASDLYPVYNTPPHVLTRKPITEQVVTGVRAIDCLTAAGKGQRLGIFSGSGVGKSTLLGMIARNTRADINVIALIGERGREVKEFLETDLGPEGLERSVIIVSTSNTPPLARLKGAFTATAIAEYFRDCGNDVMLLFDSVTRFARAQREIGLAIGEPPATRGFTPSCFSILPRLLERCGTAENGTITGFYTILVEGDDMDEPVSDTVRGIIDGHIILSRRLAQRYHYPAIDVLDSLSRLAVRVTDEDTRKAAAYIRRMLAVYRESEDLINVGAYVKGSNAEIDEAIDALPEINEFLRQDISEKAELKETIRRAKSIAGIESDTDKGAADKVDLEEGEEV